VLSEQEERQKEDSGGTPATRKFAGGKESGGRTPGSDRNLRRAKPTQQHEPKPTNQKKIWEKQGWTTRSPAWKETGAGDGAPAAPRDPRLRESQANLR